MRSSLRGKGQACLSGLALLALCGCSQPGSTAAPQAAAAPALESGITGVLHDDANRPMGGAKVLACMSTVCYAGKTSDDGRFSFHIDAPVDLVVKTEEIDEPTRLAAALLPVQFTEKKLLDVGVVHTPALPEGRPVGPARLDPQTIEAGEGLTLTLRRSAITPPLGELLVDISARRLPAATAPPLPVLAGEQVLAVYALHPFAATSKVPIPVQAPSDLPAGTVVRFRTISEIDGRLSEPIAGRASGSSVSTDQGLGITRLTYLVISR